MEGSATLPSPIVKSSILCFSIHSYVVFKMAQVASIFLNNLFNFFFTNEPSREKTNNMHICENEDQPRGNREADQSLCICFTNSTLPLLSKYKMSCF